MIRRPPPPARRAVAVALVAVLGTVGLVAGCGDDDESSGSSPATTAAAAGTPATTTSASTLPEPVPEAPPPDDGEAPPEAGSGQASPPTEAPAPVVAPDVLGVPGEFGIAYPAGTTCAPVEAVLASPALTSGARTALVGDDGVWLAVDPGSTSADVLFGPPTSESRLVTVRSGVLASSGPPSPAQSAALTPEESYAITDVAPGGTITSCIEGPVVV